MNENYFLKRRSIRHYKSEKISESDIDEILAMAAKAPTCGNMQLYSVIVTQEEDNLKKLSTLHYNQPAASTAPVILTICADFNRFTKWCEENDAEAGFDNFHSFITAMTDAVIYAQQIVTVAEMKGLGSCYLGTVTYNAKEFSELLKLPDLVVPVASVSIGVADEEGEETKRLPSEGYVFYEKYRDRDGEEVQEIFKVHSDNPENEKFIKESGKENLAQVFSEVRYPKEMNEKLSQNFIELLKEKGFLK